MLGELFGSALLGLVLALGALRWLPQHFPHHRLVLATGPVAAGGGGVATWAIMGSGHLALALLVASAVAIALVSLLMSAVSPGPQVGDQPLVAAGRHH